MIDGVYIDGFFISSLAGMALNQFFPNFLEAVPSPRNISKHYFTKIGSRKLAQAYNFAFRFAIGPDMKTK